jgi:uncharacterized membrane protein YbhN (UPF0104 family)
VTAAAERLHPRRMREHRPLAVFASAGDAERRRRPADVATLIAAALLVVGGLRQRTDPTPVGDNLSQLLRGLPDWSKTLLGAFFMVAAGYVVFVVVMAVVAGDRPGLVRDLVVAGAAATLVGSLVGRAATGTWPALEGAFDGSAPRFPVLRIATVTAVAMTAAPHVVRPVRRLGLVAIVGAAVAAIALDLGTLPGVLVGFGVGLGLAATVRLIWGSPAGAPSLYRVRSALATRGIDVGEFTQLPSERGVVRLSCTDAEGRTLEVKVYGRDAADTQLLAKAWRFLWYRSGGTSLTVTRTQQVEHETLVSLLVLRAGVVTADVVDALSTASGDKVLVTEAVPTDNSPLGPDHLECFWSYLDALRAARISHGQIDAGHVHAISADAVAITDWASATVGASAGELSRDIAAAMVLSATVAGADRAVAVAMAHVGEEQLITAVSYVQHAALTTDLRRSAKACKVDLDSLRDVAAQRAGQPAPELVKLQRVKWTSLVMSAFMIAAIWFVIGKIAEIGWDTIIEAFKGATWGWILVALLVGQLPRIADAISVLGACDQRLAFGPTVALEASISFINLAVPSTAARVAMEVRFFQKQGVAAAKALTFGALDSVSLFVTQLAILIVTVGFGLTSLDFGTRNADGGLGTALKLAIAAIIAILVGIVVVLAVRRLRTWVFHQISQAFDALKGLGSIRRWGPLFGGNLLSQLFFSITLGVCVLAFGYHVSLVNLMAINVLVSFFAGLMPIPGGVGVTEGALTAGLVAAGVPETEALSAVLVYRIFTYYLPPAWGFFAMRWLESHDYL